jgi:cytochrome b
MAWRFTFRIVWGFVGSDTARFARFLASPHAATRHLARLFRREPDVQVGHNPAGGWMVLLLLALLLGRRSPASWTTTTWPMKGR